jgi:membrane protease YdiL (CAAX protease family)
MRTILWFAGVLLGTLVLAAVLAYPVWLLAHAIEPTWTFPRVAGRFWQLLMIGGVVLALRRLRLTTREDWGWGQPRARFLRHFAVGLAIGLATMLPMSLAMLALGIHVPDAGLDAAAILRLVVAGAGVGLAVAVSEETFFRGLMYRGALRDSGPAVAIAGTALFYALIHFLGRARVGDADIGWVSGFEVLGAALARFADPATIAGSLTTLLLVGVLLGLVRHRTGGVAAGIGLHMGWVCVIKATRWSTTPAGDAHWSFLVSGFDGYTGWLVAGWAAVMLLAGLALGWLRPSGISDARG